MASAALAHHEGYSAEMAQVAHVDAAGVQPALVLEDELRVDHGRRVQGHAGLTQHDELLVGGLPQRRAQQVPRGQDQLERAPGDLRICGGHRVCQVAALL